MGSEMCIRDRYRGTGKWDRHSNRIDVPDEIGAGVNTDNYHLNSKSEFFSAQDQISVVNIGDNE